MSLVSGDPGFYLYIYPAAGNAVIRLQIEVFFHILRSSTKSLVLAEMALRFCLLYGAWVSIGHMSSAFLFDEKMDCQVTEWSEWSDPYGFGTISRERQVLRYPIN